MGLSPGKAGTVQTLKLMRRLVRKGKRNLVVRRLALKLTRLLPQKKFLAEVHALHRFVQFRIRYVKDIRGIETVHTPERTLEQGQGDCDDKSILLSALLESLGHPTRFVALAFADGSYRHVLVETKIGSSWLSLDATEPHSTGWTPAGVSKRIVVYN